MAAIVFFIAGPLAVVAALGVVVLRNPFYAVLSLVVHLLALAALFLLLRAEFLAAVQVLVYVGAVMVLYVFVNAYVGGVDDPRGGSGPNLRWFAWGVGATLVALLMIVVLGTTLKGLDTKGAEYDPGFGTPGQIGELLLTRFLLPFEAASFLLLVAAVGAVVLARRRRGALPGEERMVAALDLMAPTGTGTMREGVGAVNPVPGALSVRITPSTGAGAPGGDDGEEPRGEGSDR